MQIATNVPNDPIFSRIQPRCLAKLKIGWKDSGQGNLPKVTGAEIHRKGVVTKIDFWIAAGNGCMRRRKIAVTCHGEPKNRS